MVLGKKGYDMFSEFNNSIGLLNSSKDKLTSLMKSIHSEKILKEEQNKLTQQAEEVHSGLDFAIGSLNTYQNDLGNALDTYEAKSRKKTLLGLTMGVIIGAAFGIGGNKYFGSNEIPEGYISQAEADKMVSEATSKAQTLDNASLLGQNQFENESEEGDGTTYLVKFDATNWITDGKSLYGCIPQGNSATLSANSLSDFVYNAKQNPRVMSNYSGIVGELETILGAQNEK